MNNKTRLVDIVTEDDFLGGLLYKRYFNAISRDSEKFNVDNTESQLQYSFFNLNYYELMKSIVEYQKEHNRKFEYAVVDSKTGRWIRPNRLKKLDIQASEQSTGYIQ